MRYERYNGREAPLPLAVDQSDRGRFFRQARLSIMHTSRGVKRKRDSAKPHQTKVYPPQVSFFHWPPLKTLFNLRLSSVPNKFFRVNSYVTVLSVAEVKRAHVTLPRKHHSLQEFKRLAKRAKANETQIIVKKLKSLRSLSSEPGRVTHNPAKTLPELEAQLNALKVCAAHFEERLASHHP